jgi:hypothetical protein
MKWQESSNAFELFRCDHIKHIPEAEESKLCESVAQRVLGDSVLVGIGNALVLEDTPALRLVKELAKVLPDCFCTINLEHNFALLPEILKSHRSVYIVDSLLCDGPAGTIMFMPLTDEVLVNKNVDREIDFQFGSTHSISWFDEIKLARLQGLLHDSVTFVGIESSIIFEQDDRCCELFHQAVDLVEKVLLSQQDSLRPFSILPSKTRIPSCSK